MADSNDHLRLVGADGLKAKLNAARRERAPVSLDIGSDNEIAAAVADGLRQQFGECVFADGDLFVWADTHWLKFTDADLFSRISGYDGAKYIGSNDRLQRYRLSEPRRRSIQALICQHLAAPGFFDDAQIGINCLSGFVVFEDAVPRLVPHASDQGQKHVLQVDWNGSLLNAPKPGSALERLIRGCFDGDEDGAAKADLLCEALACAVLGLSTRLKAPKAIILYGPGAGNGKSQWLALAQALLPSGSVAHLSPRQFSDRTLLPQIKDALLNTSDELGGDAIHGEIFKQVITGDPMTGRAVYRDAVSFRCRALHMLATNTLPPFVDGMDHGVRRRVLPVLFNRTIPEDERVPGLGELIARTEGAMVLSWVLAGAQRLLARRAFEPPLSSGSVLNEWITFADPISAWLADREAVWLTGQPADELPVKRAYAGFRAWSDTEGIRPHDIPQQRIFTSRLMAKGVPQLSFARLARHRVVRGLKLVHPGGRHDP
jgi:phage/plasmid-associated DNA primase